MSSGRLPSRLLVVAGTYDGVLAGWDTNVSARPSDADDVDLRLLRRRSDGVHLKLSFAAAAHDGSVRCTDVCGAPVSKNKDPEKDESKERKRPRSDGDGGEGADDADAGPAPAPAPGSLLSGGYDEVLNVYDLRRHSQSGEIKTPGGLGSPTCCSFAPPASASSPSSPPPTHALLGTASGKIVILRRRDWSVQHVLSGHDGGGVGCLAVHPTGRMALSGGRSDGKIVLWDLTRGRLAFAHRLPRGRGGRRDAVSHIAWSGDGSRYAYCHGTKVTARDVATGEDLLDVDLPGRANQLAFVGGPEGMFVAAACDDGGLPVLEVGQLEETEEADTRRAIMAIEPVDRTVAGDDRLKCIRAVEGGSGFLVVTANSGGVVSLMDLEGAARMMLTPGGEDEDGGGKGSDGSDSDGDGSDSDSDSDDDEFDAAVEILDSVRLGSGARITDLSAWSYGGEDDAAGFEDDAQAKEDEIDLEDAEEKEDGSDENEPVQEAVPTKGGKKDEVARKRKAKGDGLGDKIHLDAEAVEKARRLVGQAKKHQKRKKRKSSSGK